MTSQKMLVVTMTDGSQWAIAAEVIADNRAQFYAEDGYKEEFDFTMTDRYELVDWAANNMNWSDVEKYTIPYKPAPKPNFIEGWNSGEKELVDTPTHLNPPIPNDVAKRIEEAR